MKVELLEVMGDDLTIVNAARVSYNKESKEFGDKDAKLIKYLWDHKHSSPFRHPQLQFRITCPIYVERQLFKHVIGVTNNSISGRYVDFSDSYYKIKTFRKQSESSKQGSGENLNPIDNSTAVMIQNNLIETAAECYKQLLNLGVSKEQARSVLPLSLETTYISTMSLQAFIHMCGLRLKSDTQKETRDVVSAMLAEVKKHKLFPKTLEYLGL